MKIYVLKAYTEKLARAKLPVNASNLPAVRKYKGPTRNIHALPVVYL